MEYKYVMARLGDGPMDMQDMAIPELVPILRFHESPEPITSLQGALCFYEPVRFQTHWYRLVCHFQKQDEVVYAYYEWDGVK